MTDETIDVERLIDEIDDEVARRRAEGGLDPEWERDLDELFVTGAPRGGADFGRLLDAAQRAAHVDATPPAASERPGGEVVKRALGRTMSWYVSNVTRQVSALGTELVEVARVLGDRVARLERSVEPDAPSGRVSLLDPHVDLAPWTPTITDALRVRARPGPARGRRRRRGRGRAARGRRRRVRRGAPPRARRTRRDPEPRRAGGERRASTSRRCPRARSVVWS